MLFTKLDGRTMRKYYPKSYYPNVEVRAGSKLGAIFSQDGPTMFGK